MAYAYKTPPKDPCACNDNISSEHGGIEEFTIYTTKPYNIVPDTCQIADKYSSIEGFNGIRSLKGAEDPLLKIDSINWENYESATNAIEMVETDEKFKAYRSSMDKIHFFGYAKALNHLTIVAPEEDHEKIDMVELKSYAVKRPDFAAHLRGRKRVLNWLLSEVPGFLGIRTYQSIDDAERYFDASFWETKEHYKWATEHLRHTPFFQVHALSIYKEHFKYTFNR